MNDETNQKLDRIIELLEAQSEWMWELLSFKESASGADIFAVGLLPDIHRAIKDKRASVTTVCQPLCDHDPDKRLHRVG